MLPVITSEYHEAKNKYEELFEKYNAWEAENNSSHEYGEITISEDGNLVTATYAVDSFSPFIVYAFVEVDEPEIKTLSAAIVEDEAASAITHTVVSGENLTDIARMYGCTVDEIVALNSDLIENPSLISVGWVLTIPVE